MEDNTEPESEINEDSKNIESDDTFDQISHCSGTNTLGLGINDDTWIDIIGTGGLKKKILKAGICESRPSSGDIVQIDAVGYLENGTKVEEMKDFIFTVEGGELIAGLDLIVKLMDKGEVSQVFMESRFAYGEKGLEPNIPPNSNLYYEVTLIDFKPEDDPLELRIDERKEIGIRKREIGNWWFNRENYDAAIKCYKSSLDYLDDTSGEYGDVLEPNIKDLLEERLRTLNNMAAAQMKVEAYDLALKSLDCLLECQPNNIKGLYRKGKVLGIQGKSAEALVFLKAALQIEPNSSIILQEAAKLQKATKKEAEQERTLYRRMFNSAGSAEKREGEEDRFTTRRIGVKSLKLWATFFITLLLSALILRYITLEFYFS